VDATEGRSSDAARRVAMNKQEHLQSHPELKSHPGLNNGLMLLLMGQLSSVEQMQKFIDGFN
jgi:hypothetical protein